MSVTVDDILATIRTRESGGDYSAQAPGSSASGAYQFIDGTWQGLLDRFGLEGPASAGAAPPALQDEVARRYVSDILAANGNVLESVPATWYVGSYDPTNLDYIPAPEAGNSLSVGEYVDHWMAEVGADDLELADDVLDPSSPSTRAGRTPLDVFLDAALAQEGDPYIFGTETAMGDADPDAFDCSELVQWAAAQAGIEITDGSWLQYSSLEKAGAAMSVEEALRTPGALVFSFSGDPTQGVRPSSAHVGISLGDGRLMEARSTRHGVGIFDAEGRTFTHAAMIPELGTEMSNPLVSGALAGGADIDSDADGLLDQFEAMIGTDPFSVDTDLDGVLDGAEVHRFGTDPLDYQSNMITQASGDALEYRPPLTTKMEKDPTANVDPWHGAVTPDPPVVVEVDSPPPAAPDPVPEPAAAAPPPTAEGPGAAAPPPDDAEVEEAGVAGEEDAGGEATDDADGETEDVDGETEDVDGETEDVDGETEDVDGEADDDAGEAGDETDEAADEAGDETGESDDEPADEVGESDDEPADEPVEDAADDGLGDDEDDLADDGPEDGLTDDGRDDDLGSGDDGADVLDDPTDDGLDVDLTPDDGFGDGGLGGDPGVLVDDDVIDDLADGLIDELDDLDP